VARLPGKLPGLYLIRIDDKGERRFFYYRSAAAARELFTDAATLPLLAALCDYDLLYFSAITLSILGTAARDRLFAALTAARAKGCRIAFDSNFPPGRLARRGDGAAGHRSLPPLRRCRIADVR